MQADQSIALELPLKIAVWEGRKYLAGLSEDETGSGGIWAGESSRCGKYAETPGETC